MDSDAGVTVPRGGPVYVTDMVSALTKVPDFEHAAFHELEGLREELCCDSLESYDDEISVEDLKVIQDEDLFNSAIEEVLRDDNAAASESSGAKSCCSTSNDSLDGDCLRACNKGKSRNKHSVKRKDNRVDHSYIMAKVEPFVRIKRKQEEDKAATRLHSFDGSRKVNNAPPKPSKSSDKLTTLKYLNAPGKAKASSSIEHVPVQYPEVVLCVEVYRNRKPLKKSQEFLVLGQQFLTEVRDLIYCVTDKVMRKAGEEDPSGYFLIEDVFYNDLRDPRAIDYSEPILDWLESSEEAGAKWESILSGELPKKRKSLLGNEMGQAALPLPRFRAAEMQKMRFCDLKFRVGAGYLYCHQGDCKHLIVIRDMRLFHPEDVQNQAAYPLIAFQVKVRLQKCSVCKINKADKMTVDDKWAPENPCYFCDLCYYMLHYEDGSLLYDDFSVYDHIND